MQLSPELLIQSIPLWFNALLFLALGIAAVVGVVLVATTRADAFDAADRHSKTIWMAILGVSAFSCFLVLPFLSWIGAVAIGLYYLDVRPHINNILHGNYDW